METLLQILKPSLPVAYAITFSIYLILFVRKQSKQKDVWGHLATPFLFVSAAAHLLYSIALGLVYEHHPMASIHEVFSIVGLSLVVVYLIIETWRKNRSTGVFVLPFVFVLQLISAIGISPSREINPILRETPFGMHTGSITLAYAAFFLSAVYAVMYTLFHRALRRKKFGLIFERFPSLDVLFRMTRGAVLVGFIFMTMGLVVGILRAKEVIPDFWRDAKIYLSILTWAVYGVALTGHYILKISSNRVVAITLAGFVTIVFSTMAVNILFPGWHQFMR